jgi:diacylglycerol O-acyltransferase / wax synthase
MIAAYPVGPLGIGTALNVTVQSYLDRLWFGILACPDVVPEPWTLTDRIANAVEDLIKTT